MKSIFLILDCPPDRKGGFASDELDHHMLTSSVESLEEAERVLKNTVTRNGDYYICELKPLSIVRAIESFEFTVHPVERGDHE